MQDKTDEPLILALDTATPVCSVALATRDRLLAETSFHSRRNHSAHLLPTINFLLQSSGIPLARITAIAAARGPGSFTGIRIGITTAKSLAFATGCEIYGIPTLDGLAFNGRHLDGLLCTLIDARKKEVFASLFKVRNGSWTTIRPAMVGPVEQVLQGLDEPVYLLGNGIPAYRERIERALGTHAHLTDPWLWSNRAASIAALAFRRRLAAPFSRVDGLTEYSSFNPVYIRRPEAEIHWREHTP